jgi:hypothetical protein
MVTRFGGSKMKIANAMIAAVFIVALAMPVMALDIGSIVDVRLAKYDPFPVKAGTVTTVYLDVVNSGQGRADNVTITISPSYPFSLPSDDPVRNVAVIPGPDSRRIEYNLIADKNARNGTYTINYKMVQESTEKKGNFSITVRESDSFDMADLVPLYVEATPAPYPMGSTKLSIDITNVDKGTAYYVIAKAFSDAFDIERNEIFVGTLEPNDFSSIDFDMVAKNVAPGYYPVNITTIYKDKNSVEISQSRQIDVKVISTQDALQRDVEPTPVWIYIIYLIGLVIIVKYVAMPLWKKARKKK